jgi:uncharacterized membrane protein
VSGAGDGPTAPALSWWRWVGLAALAGVALLPLLPVLSARLPGAAFIARTFDPWFALHCERDASRTLALGGAPWAVCARCAGIYFGLGLGAALGRPRLSPAQLRLWVVCAAAFMVADVALEHFGWHEPSAPVRVLSGLLLAYPVGVGLGALVRRAPNVTTAQSP